MTCNCCSGNFSPSPRCCCPPQDPPLALPAPATCSTAPPAAPASICQLDSSLSSGCQETCFEPTSCQRSCVVSSPCQMPCYYPRSCTPCSPCQGTYAGSLGFQSSIVHCLGYGCRRCYTVDCGSNGFESVNYGVSGFPFLGSGYRFYYPVHPAAGVWQPCYKTTCGNILYGLRC